MIYTQEEILQFVKENDIKFIKLSFCDIFGTLKNISILSSELERAFQIGASFDASSIRGFMNPHESDLFLFPDPSTLAILPWRPQQGRVARFYCDIRYFNGTPFPGDGRHLLKETAKKAEKAGFSCKIGSECEFYLFELDEKGNPTKNPHDHATYFDAAPLDKGENVRRDICLTLEQMNVILEASHHENGPGQNEIDFKYNDALVAADDLVTFKSVVKTISARNGLFASFMPKPFQNESGSGLHINMSLFQNGLNIFNKDQPQDIETAKNFIAGIMNRIEEITLFLNPITNSYERFGYYEAPRYITWSPENRSQLIRIPAAAGDYSRMELRSPDPSCNPYLAFSLLICAGLEGIEKKIPLCEPANFNVYTADSGKLKNIPTLPDTLQKAILKAEGSSFVKSVLPSKIIEKTIEAKANEWQNYIQAVDKDDFEKELYFFST